MLFSGGTATTKSKKDEKRDKRVDRDEKYELQEQVFIRWANHLLGTERLQDFRSLQDASNALFTVQMIVSQPMAILGSPTEDWPNILLMIGDTRTNPTEVIEGNQKAVLSAWWQIIQFYWRHRAPTQLREEKLSETIKQWCVEVTKSYEDVQVYDFTSSFRDGHAFNYLLHSFNKKLVNLSKTAEMSAIDRIENAFSIAESEWGVARVLTPKDLHSDQLDSHSVLCYLMNLYLAMISHSKIEEEIEAHQKAAKAMLHKMQPAAHPSTSSALQVPLVAPSTTQQPVLDRGKSFEQSVESEVRSRKSSSSSQKSGKSKKQRREEQVTEFKNCIEQVLTWLLEAEDELATLTALRRADLAAVRSQFADFETFMSSLTESQDTVGRVLLRGQMLSNKSESDEEKDAISSQLTLVNTRWEALREQAMQEQTALQSQINQLQQNEIEEIQQWLSATENQIETFGPIAADATQSLMQIEEHQKFQAKINDFQGSIDRLESFVAVVDEENEASVASLEDALTGIASRWHAICEWAEKRAAQLDGLAELITHTGEVFDGLAGWLVARESEIASLKSAHHLEDEHQVRAQIKLLQRVEGALEAEHPSFVKLSQLSCDLVSRLNDSNPVAANTVRDGLDGITRRWDLMVARIEEVGKTLVESGKADVKEVLERRSSQVIEETISEGISTDTEGEERKNMLVDKFLMHISKLSHELVPLQEWSESFSVSRRPDQIRQMMNTCQEKLIQIKDQEARVNRLQLDLEHLHAAKLNSKQLKRANDAFESFAKGWARIVTKISEAMNILTGHAHDGEEAAVAAKIEQWIAAVDKVISELANLPVNERSSRIEKLDQQLKVQEKNVGFIEKDLVKKAILKKGLDIVRKRLDGLKGSDTIPSEMEVKKDEVQSAEEQLIRELDGVWSNVGDLESLEADLIRAQLAVDKSRSCGMSNETVEKAETRKAEMEERKRVTEAARQRFTTADTTIGEIEASVARLIGGDLGVVDLVSALQKEADKLAGRVSQRKEAERTAEKMISIDDALNEEIVTSIRCAIEKLTNRWVDLEKQLDDRLSKAKRDQHVFIQKRLREGEEALEEIRQVIEKKRDSLDAEAAAEHLDHLENSLDNITSLFGEIGSLPMDDESREKLSELAEAKEEIAKRATDAVAALSRTVSECEDFEKQIMTFQHWSTKIGFLLNARKASDISAFDIPHEFHKLNKEFEEWSSRLGEMEKLAMEREDAVRMNEQLMHANSTMAELKRKFNEFKRPKSFEEKLDKLLQTLGDVEMGLDDTTGIEGSECGGALMEVRSLMRTIDVSMEQLKDLNATREQLLADKILDEEPARETLRKVQYAKTKTKELYERAVTCVERLEDCVEMYQRLRCESDDIEKFLDGMEQRLDQFAATDRPEEDHIVNELIAEWNRNEASMNNAAHLQRQLNERGIKLGDDIVGLKRLRADALKNRLNSWCRTIQEMGDDDESALLEIDELHQTIASELNSVAEETEPALVAEKLRFLRADRDRLSSRARKLAAKNPNFAATSSAALTTLNNKWNELEKRSVCEPSNALPKLVTKQLSQGASFEKRVEELAEMFSNIGKYLDFDTSPVSSVNEYEKRVDELDAHLDEYRPSLDDVIDEGRKIAETGRLELQTHRAIERLDELADQIEQVETDLARHRGKLASLSEQHEHLRRDVEAFLLVLDVFGERNLDDAHVAQATRRELAERDAHIASLTSRATALHCSLPGKGPQMPNALLNNLRNRIERLEAQFACEPNVQNEKRADEEKEKSSPDRTSSMPLAMEAYGTATEDESLISEHYAPSTETVLNEPVSTEIKEIADREEFVAEVCTEKNIIATEAEQTVERVVREVPVDCYEETLNISSGDEKNPEESKEDPATSSSEDDVAKMFEELDGIEESLTNFEEFPFDYIDTAEQDIQNALEKLRSCEEVLSRNEMTINIMQSESGRERIQMLRQMTQQKGGKLAKLVEEWATLNELLSTSEKLVDEIVRFENDSQPLNNPQSVAELKNKIAKAQNPVMELVKKLALVVPRMQDESPKSQEIREKVYDIEDRFRRVSSATTEADQRLASEAIDENAIKERLAAISEWCDDAEREASQNVNSLDMDGLDELSARLDVFIKQLADRRNEMVQLEFAKNAAVVNLKGDAHHTLRRIFSDTAKRVATVRDELSDARQWVNNSHDTCESFWRDLDEVNSAARDVSRRANAIRHAVIYTPSRESVEGCRRDAERLRASMAEIKKRVQTANLPPAIKLAGRNAKRVVQVLTDAAATIADAQDLVDEMSESGGDTTESRSTVVEMKTLESAAAAPASESSEEMRDEDEQQSPTSSEETTPEPPVLSNQQTAKSATDPVAIQLTHTRHWLHDVERDASITVDLAEWKPARDLWQTVQGICDEIRLRSVQVTGLHDSCANRQVRQQAEQLLVEMRRTVDACDRRCQTLNQISDMARHNENSRTEMEVWLKTSHEKIGEKRVEECSEDVVRQELRTLEKLVDQLEERKTKMQEINTEANKIVDTFTKDEAHNLSHLLSRLNMSWSKFNDNIRIRRAVLEASLRSRRDFHSALDEFETWLARQEANCARLASDTSNTQAVKDTTRRTQWTNTFKILNAELSAHEAVMRSVESMGKMLAEGLENGSEKAELQMRIADTSRRWTKLRDTTFLIGERLEKAEQEWEKLSDGLADLLSWIETRKQKVSEEQPIGGSLSAVMQQSVFIKTLQREMEQKQSVFKKTIASAHSFLMQHDLRPKLHSPQVLDDFDRDEENSDLEQRRRGLQINANCEQLKKNWEELGIQVDSWDKIVQHAMQRLQELERNLAECQLHLTSSEHEVESMKAVEKIHLEDLKIAREETDQVGRRIDEVRLFIDDVNDSAARLLAEDLKLDEHARGQIESVNKRYSTLKRAIRIRQAAVRNAASDFGPTSEHFLNQSVALPWQRAISKSNLLPYYIEQTTEKTQWEHPVWVEILKELTQFNRVKFIAYRTAMKLRALQKRLCLDLVDVTILEKAFVRLKGLSAEECPGLEGMVCALLPMFEALHAKHPNQVQSVSLAVDVCINFLLNLFDQSRDGIMRVLSFKIALIVFSNISLDEKYKYLFKLVSQDGHATQKQVALLLYDLIHIPRLVGESAAFGGSNVEPSVRSCFETVRLAPTISEAAFIDWVKKEPQSIVWLAVMHRLSASENTKHASKCNVCKMFPIVGLRYRCLSCFNLDLCQNCFFSQRTAKRHKLKHPMQEYSGRTTSTDDARDFAKMLRNKLRSTRRPVAYLPIDVAEEGAPLTCPPAKVTNHATQGLNTDTSQMTAHLATLGKDHAGERLQFVEPVQSPLQIINQVEQMQRDEMDQLLHRLQIENQQLRKELEVKRTATSTFELDRSNRRTVDRRSESRGGTLPLRNGRSVMSLKSTHSQNDVMDEAKALRLHKQRLEHRSRILEQQNEQLEMQLQRLKKVIDTQKQQDPWSPERATSARSESVGPQSPEIISNPMTNDDAPRGSSVGQMQNLMNACDDLGRAMESLVVSVVYDSDENED